MTAVALPTQRTAPSASDIYRHQQHGSYQFSSLYHSLHYHCSKQSFSPFAQWYPVYTIQPVVNPVV